MIERTRGKNPTPADAGGLSRVADGAGADPGIEIDIVVEAERWLAYESVEGIVRTTAAAFSRHLGAGDLAGGVQTATLALCDDALVARLNETYRGKPGPTNVLSFPASVGTADDPCGDCDTRYLGDIVMAFETMAAEARDMEISLWDHFRHLLVHGLLHLLGHDHEREEDARKMEALEISVLKTLGVANPYATGFEP